MTSGAKIKALMDELDMNSAQFAKEIETTPQHVSDILNDKKTNPTERTLWKMCDVLHCKPEDIR